MPEIIGGIPIRMRSIQVNIDKPNFMINPTNCSPFSVASQGIGDQGTVGRLLLLLPRGQLRDPALQAEDDDHPARRPQGDQARARTPALRFDLNTRPGDANIKSIAVTLPNAFEIDQRHLGNICSEAELEATQCAGRQPIGTVNDETPLLEQPLEGPVYAVSGYGGLPHVAFILDGQVTSCPRAESEDRQRRAPADRRSRSSPTPRSATSSSPSSAASTATSPTPADLCAGAAVTDGRIHRPERQDTDPEGADQGRLRRQGQTAQGATTTSFETEERQAMSKDPPPTHLRQRHVDALPVRRSSAAHRPSPPRQLAKNSVGSRQLKSKAVTTGKIANNAVNGSKVANGSLTGADINLSQLGTVPSATSATTAGNANTVGGHSAACPSGTTLIRGICFDSHANPVVDSVQEAADACAAKGGYLPTPMELYATRGVLNLGTGIGTDKQFTDSYYYDASTGEAPPRSPSTAPGRSPSRRPATPPNTPAPIRWCGRGGKRQSRGGCPRRPASSEPPTATSFPKWPVPHRGQTGSSSPRAVGGGTARRLLPQWPQAQLPERLLSGPQGPDRWFPLLRPRAYTFEGGKQLTTESVRSCRAR